MCRALLARPLPAYAMETAIFPELIVLTGLLAMSAGALATARRHSPRLVLMLALLFGLQGCREGYPEGDEPLLSSAAEMNADQRLEQLAVLGSDASPHQIWRYALQPGCRLQVEHRPRRWFSDAQSVEISLDRTEIRIDAIEDSEVEHFRVIARPGPDQPRATADEVMLLDHGSWPDAIQFRALLIHLQKDCRDDRISWRSGTAAT